MARRPAQRHPRPRRDERGGERAYERTHRVGATPIGRHRLPPRIRLAREVFPEGRTLIAQIEEQIWDELVGLGATASPTIFDDQYISTGGQFYELLAGHDRFVGDIRPLVHAALDLDSTLVCHPYDVAAALVLTEAGIVYESPFGGFPDAPLDTTSPVAWFAYANETLAAQLRPVLTGVLGRSLA